MLKTKFLKTGFFCQGLILATVTGKINSGNILLTQDTVKAVYNSSLPYTVNDTLANESSANTVIGINPGIGNFSKKYIHLNKSMLKKLNEQNQHHFKIMDQVFQKYELPLQLKYLAVVESKLKSTATSKVGAKGYWQMMPVTGRSLGLVINEQRDDRTHCYRSTVAAAKYLKELHLKFNDWLLVIAAYNGGAGSVYKAIKRSGSRDFWKLQYFLPFETRMHVKKYISTHYYYEGNGGMTTMSKTETEDYLTSEEKLSDTFPQDESTKSNADLTSQEKIAPVNPVVIVRKEN